MTTNSSTATPPPARTTRLAAPAVEGNAAKAKATAQKGRLPLPAEIIICPWGESRDLAGQPVICNETTLAQLAANQAKYGFDEVALDFSHNTAPVHDEKGNAIKPAEPLPIAAMGSLDVRRGVGIVFTPLSWTEQGEQFYTGRHYRDLSPTVSRNDKGEVTFVHSVALTRNGQIPDLHAFAAAAGLPALTTLSTPIPTTTSDMDTTAPDYRALLLKVLKLEDTATDEQVIALVEKSDADAMGAGKKMEEELTPMSAAQTPTVDALAAITARQDELEKSNLIAEATRAGKIVPLSAEALKLTPLDVVKDLVKNLPANVVPMTTTPPAKEPTTDALSADEEAVRQRMGISLEQWKAAKA